MTQMAGGPVITPFSPDALAPDSDAGETPARRGRPARTRLRPEQRRDLIIDAAEQAFAGRDPSDVTFEQIAELAGVSRALVYNYFGDKGGLLAGVYLRSFERLDVALGQAYEHHAPGPDQLRAILACYLDFAEQNPGGCQLISLAEATEHPLVQRARRRRYERMAGGWGQTSEARLVARAILGLLESAVLQWLEDPDCDRQQAENTLFTLLWSGLSGIGAGALDTATPAPAPDADADADGDESLR